MISFKIGDRVVLDRIRDWDSEMPEAAQKAFIYAQYHPCPIVGFTEEGLAILDLREGDAEIGGSFNDIRVEPESLNLAITLPEDPRPFTVEDSIFPIVEGFKLELVKEFDGMNVAMRTGDGRDLAHFLYSHAEKGIPTFGSPRFPLGPQSAPFMDCDQGWSLRIWEADGFVYVAEGRGEPDFNTFDVHFRVPLAVYLSEWKRLDEETAMIKEVFDNLAQAMERPEAAKELQLSQQHLSELPDVFSRFINLEKLELRSNRLTFLPDSIGDLKNLRHLALDDNKLTSLPASMGKLEKLEIAWLANNKLTAIPDYVKGMKNLKEFMVNYNPIPAEQVKSLKAARPDMRVDPGMDENHFPWLGYR